MKKKYIKFINTNNKMEVIKNKINDNSTEENITELKNKKLEDNKLQNEAEENEKIDVEENKEEEKDKEEDDQEDIDEKDIEDTKQLQDEEEQEDENEEIDEKEEDNDEKEQENIEDSDIDNESLENEYLMQGGRYDLEIPIETISNNPLINSEKIKNKVEEYLNNYFSKEYSKFQDNLELFYKKMKKNEYLKHEDNTIYLVKNNKSGGQTIIDKIKKPKYIHISKRINELELQSKSLHSKLVFMFNNLKSKIITDPSEIKEFKKEKNKYISLLEEKEVLDLYFITINKINVNEEENNVIYQNKEIKVLNSKDITLVSKNYKISTETVNYINTIQSERLNQYNDLMISLRKGKVDKETKDKIKEYLSNKELKSIISKNNDEKNKQDNYIDYIIIEKP